jgi:capsular polysaccharide export protein
VQTQESARLLFGFGLSKVMNPVSLNRRFLLLQGPHGPFFGQLGAMLRQAGAKVWRVGFNLGDQVFWPDKSTFIASHDTATAWPEKIDEILRENEITDIVLYGDTRPAHAAAIQAARALGLAIHVFEEGYLRPYWVTYERGGSNGHSRLMSLDLSQIQAALSQTTTFQPEAPAHWGDLRQHMFWGAVYHGLVWAGGRRFPAFRPHRALRVDQEFQLYLRRLIQLPVHRWERMLATTRIRRGGYPYHLALLQLEHDASFRAHSPFTTMSEFISLVIGGFALGALPHHHLVFKAHPLEDGRVPVADEIRRMARRAGVADRVHFVRGGKLARLLDHARSAVTINSTAGQQVLWRGLPLKIFGAAVYDKSGLVSEQSLPDFFKNPDFPDHRAYRDFRRFLLETSQIPGGFYSSGNRRVLLRRIVDRMLSRDDPYESLTNYTAASAQQLRLVR